MSRNTCELESSGSIEKWVYIVRHACEFIIFPIFRRKSPCQLSISPLNTHDITLICFEGDCIFNSINRRYHLDIWKPKLFRNSRFKTIYSDRQVLIFIITNEVFDGEDNILCSWDLFITFEFPRPCVLSLHVFVFSSCERWKFLSSDRIVVRRSKVETSNFIIEITFEGDAILYIQILVHDPRTTFIRKFLRLIMNKRYPNSISFNYDVWSIHLLLGKIFGWLLHSLQAQSWNADSF